MASFLPKNYQRTAVMQLLGIVTVCVLLLSIVSYWISLFVAIFSTSTLDFWREPLLPITIIVAIVLVYQIKSRGWWQAIQPADPLASPQNQRSSWQILAADWQRNWRAIGIAAVLTTLVFFFFWLVWGVSYGGDGSGFLMNYLQLNDSYPVFYFQQLYWPPLAGIFYGGLLDLGGLPLLVFGQFFQAVSASCAIFLLANAWGRLASWLLIALWWAHLLQQVYFHLVAADSMVMWLLTFWILFLRYAVQYQTLGFWIVVGVLTGVLVLVRAGNVVLTICLMGVFLQRKNWRTLIQRGCVGLAGVLIIVVPYIVYNGIRYDSFTLARGGNTLWFSATYLPHSIIDPANGPASRELANLVETNLLTTETYQGISVEQFFAAGTFRTHEDTVALIDRTKGWDSNYALLRDVAIEAIRAHPIRFLRYASSDFIKMLVAKQPLTKTEGSSQEVSDAEPPASREIIGRAYASFLASRPDNTQSSEAEIEAATQELEQFDAPIRDERSIPAIGDWLSKLWLRFGFHPLLAWGLAVPVSLWFYRGRTRGYLAILLISLASISFPSSLVIVQIRYRTSLDMILILFLVTMTTLVIRPSALAQKEQKFYNNQSTYDV